MAELKARFGDNKVDAELIAGSGGIFDVEIDNQLIYSKHQTGQFPRYREIVSAIEQKIVDT